MKKKLLLLLADHLSTVDPKDYTITSFAKDALAHATRIPEFKKLGLRLVDRTNDNKQRGQWHDEPGGTIVEYKGALDIEAAAVFFDISNVHAQYLFGEIETDPMGNVHKSPCGSKREKGTCRDTEWPAWTVARIKAYLHDPDTDYVTRSRAA